MVTPRILVVLLLFLIPFFANARNERKIDSLKTLIATATHDTSICIAYLKLGEAVYVNHPDTALTLWQISHDLTQEKLAGDLPKPLEEKYLAVLADLLNNMGYIYKSFGDIPTGLEYYHRSLKIYEKLARSTDDSKVNAAKKGEAVGFNNIGSIYKHQGDYEKALEYFQKGLTLRQEIGHEKGVATSLNNIGNLYNQMGEREKGLEYYHRSLKMYEELNYRNGIALSLNNIGNVYYKLKDNAMGMTYFLRSLEIREKLGDKKGLSICLHNIGTSYLVDGDVENAKKYGLRSMQLAVDLKYPKNITSVANLLFKVYRREGKFEQALEMYELHIQMRDSIRNEQTQKATIRQQTRYEFEKAQLVKEQDEKEQARVLAEETSRRDNLQYSIVLICLLVIGLLVAMLGRLSLPVRVAEGMIFFAFLILFEFILVLADPYVDSWTGGAPGLKLLINAGVAALIFPLHAFFERGLKSRLVKQG